MDKNNALNIAEKYAEVLRSRYGNIRIFLFGSFIKGNYTDSSDIDIAVILKDYSNLRDIQLELMKLRRDIDSRIEPHPFREDDFNLSNPFVYEIIKSGQEVAIG